MTYDLDEMLLEILGSKELVAQWWDSPNRAFGEDTPEQVFRERPDNVVMYIGMMAHV